MIARTEEDRDHFMLLGAKTHVVTEVRCMMSAVAKSICSKYFINRSTAVDACMCETCIGSPVAFVVQRFILPDRGKMHGRKSIQDLAMARREFGELTGGRANEV